MIHEVSSNPSHSTILWFHDSTILWKTSHILDDHTDFYVCNIQTSVHQRWKCIAKGDDYIKKVFCNWEFCSWEYRAFLVAQVGNRRDKIFCVQYRLCTFCSRSVSVSEFKYLWFMECCISFWWFPLFWFTLLPWGLLFVWVKQNYQRKLTSSYSVSSGFSFQCMLKLRFCIISFCIISREKDKLSQTYLEWVWSL